MDFSASQRWSTVLSAQATCSDRYKSCRVRHLASSYTRPHLRTGRLGTFCTAGSDGPPLQNGLKPNDGRHRGRTQGPCLQDSDGQVRLWFAR